MARIAASFRGAKRNQYRAEGGLGEREREAGGLMAGAPFASTSSPRKATPWRLAGYWQLGNRSAGISEDAEQKRVAGLRAAAAAHQPGRSSYIARAKGHAANVVNKAAERARARQQMRQQRRAARGQ